MERKQKSYKKFLILFIFLIILFLLNTKTVFAKKGTAASKAGGLTAINIVEIQENGRFIFADSYDLGYIHFGLTKNLQN